MNLCKVIISGPARSCRRSRAVRWAVSVSRTQPPHSHLLLSSSALLSLIKRCRRAYLCRCRETRHYKVSRVGIRRFQCTFPSPQCCLWCDRLLLLSPVCPSDVYIYFIDFVWCVWCVERRRKRERVETPDGAVWRVHCAAFAPWPDIFGYPFPKFPVSLRNASFLSLLSVFWSSGLPAR